MNASHYSKLTSWLISAWFLLALSASALHLLNTPSTVPPIPLGIAAVLPLFLFGAWYALSPSFREFCLGLDRSVLTMIQSWRVAGFVFLVLYSYHILPGMFALPAGWGDIAIGVTAAFVARNWTGSKQKIGFIAWQLLGVTDLVTALALGSTVSLIHPEGIPTSAMSELPMSLIPTFAVPLFLIFHFICIVQAARSSTATSLLFQRSNGDRSFTASPAGLR